MNKNYNPLKEDDSRIKDSLQNELVMFKKLYRASRRIQRDLNNNDLKRAFARLKERQNVLNRLRDSVHLSANRQNLTCQSNQTAKSSLVSEVKIWMSKFLDVNEIIMRNAEKKRNDFQEGLDNLHKSKNAIMSYSKNLNAKQIIESHRHQRSV